MADESSPKVSPRSISNTEVGISDAESDTAHPPPGNTVEGSYDTRIFQDVKRFQEMDASWKYEGRYQFLDLGQADGEIFYLGEKISELKVTVAELKEDAEEQVQKYESAENNRQRTFERIDDLKADMAKLEDDIEKDELDKRAYKKQETTILRFLDEKDKEL